MRVFVSEGEFADAEILRFVRRCVIVELETGEEAVVSWGSLLGDTQIDKAQRFASLKLGQPMRVLIEQVFEGGRSPKRCINAKEAAAKGS